jgi:hypothetical protein
MVIDRTWSLTGHWDMVIDRTLDMVIDRKLEHSHTQEHCNTVT